MTIVFGDTSMIASTLFTTRHAIRIIATITRDSFTWESIFGWPHILDIMAFKITRGFFAVYHNLTPDRYNNKKHSNIIKNVTVFLENWNATIITSGCREDMTITIMVMYPFKTSLYLRSSFGFTEKIKYFSLCYSIRRRHRNTKKIQINFSLS